MGIVRKVYVGDTAHGLTPQGPFDGMLRLGMQKAKRMVCGHRVAVEHGLVIDRAQIAHIITDGIIAHAPAQQPLLVITDESAVHIRKAHYSQADERRDGRPCVAQGRDRAESGQTLPVGDLQVHIMQQAQTVVLDLVAENHIRNAVSLAALLQGLDMPADTFPLLSDFAVHAPHVTLLPSFLGHETHLAVLFVELILIKLERAVNKFFLPSVDQLKHQRIGSVASHTIFVQFQFYACHILHSFFNTAAKIP